MNSSQHGDQPQVLRPQLTIGLPVYNGARYLRNSLESILSQEYRDFELIASDNASTDETADILRDYAARDARIRIVTSESNRGGAWNFNRVLGLANTPYFKWASHDDLLLPGFLSKCMEAFRAASQDVILVYPRSILIDDIGETRRDYDDRMELLQDSPRLRLRTHLENCRLVNFLFGIWRTEALKSTGGMQSFAHADRVLVAQLALRGKFIEVPDRVFARRLHPGMSWQAHGQYEGFADWFDTSRHHVVVFPTWRVSRGLVTAVLEAEVPLQERLGALGTVGSKWVVKRRGALARELLRSPKALRQRWPR